MERETSWEEAVSKALAKRGGRGSPVQLYPYVSDLKGEGLTEERIKHRIRSTLHSLKQKGRVEHIDAGVWQLTKWF